MEKHDSFDKKIKAKLEEAFIPYDDTAWDSFAPLLAASKVPFWSKWYMPYIYSTGLFLLAMFIFSTHSSSPIVGGQENEMHPVKATPETIVQKDTIYIVDTVFIVKKIFLNETVVQEVKSGKEISDKNRGTDILLADASTQNSEVVSNLQNINRTPTNDILNIKKRDEVFDYPSGLSQNNKSTYDAPFDTMESYKIHAAQLATSSSDSLHNQAEELLILPEEDKPQGDQTQPDRSTFTKTKNKPFVNLESSISLMVPIGNAIEYYNNMSQGIYMGLEWKNGWGIYLGGLRNNTRGEIDDDELTLIDPSILPSSTGIPINLDQVDEIYLSNRQWFLPLEFRWKSADYNGFSFQSTLAILGNYLMRQRLEYEYDHRLMIDIQSETLRSNEFSLSHLKIGVGTSLVIGDHLGMFLRSHYWMPIAPTGLFENKMHGLEVGVGINYYIRKK